MYLYLYMQIEYTALLFTLGRRSKLFSGCEECRYRGHCLSGALAHQEVPGIETLDLVIVSALVPYYQYSFLHRAMKSLKEDTAFLAPRLTGRCWGIETLVLVTPRFLTIDLSLPFCCLVSLRGAGD